MKRELQEQKKGCILVAMLTPRRRCTSRMETERGQSITFVETTWGALPILPIRQEQSDRNKLRCVGDVCATQSIKILCCRSRAHIDPRERGTRHEHLLMFGLINMNAAYRPIVGRFLSPDPYVQAPDWSQNFNRYAYAMNNPFRYTDESGEILAIPIIIGLAADV